MARIGIIGREGRMGQALARAIADAGHEEAGGVDRGDVVHGRCGGCDGRRGGAAATGKRQENE